MVNIKNIISEEEDALLSNIYTRVSEELRELIEDYLLAVKEEVDDKKILDNINIVYKDVNISIILPIEREKEVLQAAEVENKKSIPSHLYL